MHVAIFVILYLLVMIPTYFIRVSFMRDAQIAGDASGLSALREPEPHGWLLLCYLLLVIITFLRGRTVKKAWIAAFPFVGGAFDLLLPIIPLVPTVMNIITIVFGVQSPPAKNSSGD